LSPGVRKTSPSSDLPTPAEALISEPVVAAEGSFDAESMARGEPGVPTAFTWRGREYRVRAVVNHWKTLRDCRSGSGEKYVGKHYFKVEADSGERMTLYRARTGSKNDSWILYSIEKNKESTR
jgi:hypothetical protein